MKKQLKCYIYTRVSTSMQVDGYSLDAQKDKLHKYADYQNMIIAGEYSDEGKSGKSVEGRPQFQQMLQDIESGKDNIDFVLVFKLSRFGRNAADVLSSLQRMQDFGVNLICVEDGIDSSKDAGKLMISVLSAVAEIERENILVQTMEGRRQKAREGKWNEDRINAAVEEIIRKFVKNPKFEEEIRKQIGGSIDTSELDREYDGLKDRLSQTTGAKNRLADQMDHLPVSDKNYDKKYNDMQERLDRLYDEITGIENVMEEVTTRLYNIKQDKISEDNVYQFLLFFDKLYDKFTDLEKKTFLKSFLSDVFIYEEEQKDGRILRGLRFKFPIYLNGRNVLGVDWDNESTDETICSLTHIK